MNSFLTKAFFLKKTQKVESVFHAVFGVILENNNIKFVLSFPLVAIMAPIFLKGLKIFKILVHNHIQICYPIYSCE